MKLSDVMSAADLSVYAEVGLVLFLLAFIGVAVRVFFFSREDRYDEAARIPLLDQPTDHSREEARSGEVRS